jgi:hypothetical protein
VFLRSTAQAVCSRGIQTRDEVRERGFLPHEGRRLLCPELRLLRTMGVCIESRLIRSPALRSSAGSYTSEPADVTEEKRRKTEGVFLAASSWRRSEYPAWSCRAGAFGSSWRRRRPRRWTVQSAIMVDAVCAAGYREAAASSQGHAAEHCAAGALWDCGGFDERRLVVEVRQRAATFCPVRNVLVLSGGTYPPSLRWASSARNPLSRLASSHVAACAVTQPPRGIVPSALRGSGRLSPDPEVGAPLGADPE